MAVSSPRTSKSTKTEAPPPKHQTPKTLPDAAVVLIALSRELQQTGNSGRGSRVSREAIEAAAMYRV